MVQKKGGSSYAGTIPLRCQTSSCYAARARVSTNKEEAREHSQPLTLSFSQLRSETPSSGL
eukprot:786106-Rhodomonas_salina.1